MAIQYTDPKTVDGTKIATDVFNTINVDAFLKPDKTLASLEAKLRKATGNEAIEIQKQIDARQAELTAQYGSVGFGSGGYIIPNYAYSEASGAGYEDLLTQQKAVQGALAGKMQLIPTSTYYTDPVTGQTTNLNPIYQSQYYGPQGQTGWMKDPVTGEIYDPMDPVRMEKTMRDSIAGTTDPKKLRKTFYNADGTEVTPEELAKTAQGVGFAKAGYDIGFGPGMLPGGVNAREIFRQQGNDGLRDILVNNLVLSGEMPIPGYDPVTGTVTQVTGTTTPTGTRAVTGTSSNMSTGTSSTVNPFLPGSDAAKSWDERKSAYDLLYDQFNQYGLSALVEPLKGLITSGASPSEFTIKLRETDAYKKRFAANAARIQKGLTAISEAEYLGLEDQYQNIMRNYGLPAEYYARGDMGTQEGFNKFIANDVSATELEDRIMTAQNRVINSNPEVLASLKSFYPDITNGDILAYTLDPTKGLDAIKRKVNAAEIGGAATQAGLNTGVARAEELTAAGINKQQAQQGFGTIAGGLERGSQLASIYGENPYTQTTAEKEVFGLAGKTEAEKERKKLTGLERATFSGQTGLTSAALVRDRAGAY
jgi:hypothetical protein